MAGDLHVSKDLELPRQFVTHRNAVLAMSGAGKSNLCVVLAEEMSRCGVPWVAIDPKGDWWGVRAAADGKGRGLDVPILGGEHGDLPLSPRSGARMAELVAGGKLQGVFDVSSFDDDEVSTFLIDFGAMLLAKLRTPLHVFFEECSDYLPQPGSSGRLAALPAECLKVLKKLSKQGRFRGLGYTLISQRAADVNKSALYQCETLFAMRVVGEHDKTTVRKWIQQQADATEIMKALPMLEDGEAWLCSPQKLKLMRRVRFRRRTTFDSGRTPEVGEALAAPKLTAIDVGALRAEMEAFDAPPAPPPEERPNGAPQKLAELRGQVAALERELAAAREGALPSAMVERLEAAAQRAHDTGIALVEAARDVIAALPTTRTNGKPAAGGDVRPDLLAVDGAPGLQKCARSILTAIAQHGDLSLTQAAIIAGYASDSGGVRNAAGELRAGGFVEGSNAKLAITGRGRVATAGAPELPTGAKLAEYWYGKLDRAERLILGEVVAVYPKPLSLKDAAKRAGYEPSSGGVRNAAGKLRTLALVHGGNGGMTADKRIV